MNKPEQLTNGPSGGVIVFTQAPTLPPDPLSATRATIKKETQKPFEIFGEEASIAIGEILEKAA